VVHPLSGVANPTDFDLDTGRLSVMASRHQVALFVVSRESVGEVLRENLPSATQALGVDDETGNGHRQHSKFWSSFDEGHTIDLSVDFVA
jgi:predicted kinase